ncbi:CU044_2847 family protein [Streptomyces sp. NPDC002643]
MVGKGEPYVSFIEAAGERVQVEVQPPQGGFRPVSRERGLGHLSETFRPVMRVAETFVREVRDSPARPDEVQLRFGVKLAATGEAVLSQGIADGHFEVTLSWSRTEPVTVERAARLDDYADAEEPPRLRGPESDDVW